MDRTVASEIKLYKDSAFLLLATMDMRSTAEYPAAPSLFFRSTCARRENLRSIARSDTAYYSIYVVAMMEDDLALLIFLHSIAHY